MSPIFVISAIIGFAALKMNLHLLRHMASYVLNWGPLWVFSCFSFESLNGDLKKYFHGTTNMSEQVSSVHAGAILKLGLGM